MLTHIDDMVGDDEEDTNLLRQMAADARAYISSFSWCPTIISMYLGYGAGGVMAVFLAHFEKKIAETDKALWIVVGDLPSAYMVAESDDSPREAIDRYCQMMDGWINEVLSFGNFAEVFPVKADRTAANAELLRRRLNFIRDEILPLASAQPLSLPN